MISPELKRLIKAQNKKLSKAKKQIRDPLGNIRTYQPVFTSHRVMGFRGWRISLNGGCLYEYEIPSSHEMGLQVSALIGDPKKGAGRIFASRRFPMRGETRELEDIFSQTDSLAFWMSLGAYETAFAESLNTLSRESTPLKFMPDERPNQFSGVKKSEDPELQEIEATLYRITKHQEDGVRRDASFSLNDAERFYCNSQGTEIHDSRRLGNIYLAANVADSKGRIITLDDLIYFRDLSEMPSEKTIRRRLEKLVKVTKMVAKAPIQEAGEFPVLLDALNTAVIFHEVVGHSLEGHRVNGTGTGEIAYAFKGMIDSPVAPNFINLKDDPSQTEFNGIKLNGHYQFDDEGVNGRRVQLIQEGVLRGYLHSRGSAGEMQYLARGGTEILSNGHARSDGVSIPVPRMGNLFVRSTSPVTTDELKEMLITECKKQNIPYGLLLQGCNGGLSLPEESIYQTSPAVVRRVYQDGSEEIVRGVYVVGTPRQTLNHIVAMSDDYQAFNGYCGAESGYVPSSEVAPSCLVRSLEVNRIPNDNYERRVEDVVN